MSTILIEPHYLGNMEYFVLLQKQEKVLFEVNQYFTKQTYKNRFEMLGTQGVLALSIPVSYHRRTPLKEVTIDHSQSWTRDHWGAIYSAYGKAPFFEFFADTFRSVWDKKHRFLVDLNLDFLTICLKLLRIDITFDITEGYIEKDEKAVSDYREVILPKKAFGNRNIYHPEPYIQNFGNEFVPNLSIIDLLFMQGGSSGALLRKSEATI